MHKLWVLVLLVSGFFLLPCWTTAAPAEGQAGPLLRVGLWCGQPNVVVSSNVAFQLSDSSGHVLRRHQPGEKVFISAQGHAVTVDGQEVKGAVQVIPERDSAQPALIMVNGRYYRGQVTVQPAVTKAGLVAINTLPVEEYLYGVIKMEISPAWPEEAVKAQAVAARTYALYSRGKHQADGYDIAATTEDQVYGGYDSEDARGNKAVDDTRGLVMTYQGKLIAAYFHSSSGGYTENSENVWGTYLPYLRAVPDYDQQSPHFRWQRQVSVAELERVLAGAGHPVGRLEGIFLSPLSQPPVEDADRGVSGRVMSIRFTGSTGSAVLTGNQVRKLLNLPSTMFDVAVISPIKGNVPFAITNSYGDHVDKQVAINLPPAEEKTAMVGRADWRFVADEDQMVQFNGYGWGHGLGLSQWGAKAMAEAAPKNDTTYFKHILQHYYQNVNIVPLY